jgi:hypothetical protein
LSIQDFFVVTESCNFYDFRNGLPILGHWKRYESSPVQIELSMQIPNDHNECGSSMNCEHHAAERGSSVGNQTLSNGEHVVVAYKAK